MIPAGSSSLLAALRAPVNSSGTSRRYQRRWSLPTEDARFLPRASVISVIALYSDVSTLRAEAGLGNHQHQALQQWASDGDLPDEHAFPRKRQLHGDGRILSLGPPYPIELTVYAVVQRRGQRACVHRAVL